MADTWQEYQKLVIAELERLATGVEKLEQRSANIETEIALLKLKSGVWGFAAGMIPAIGALLFVVLGK